MLLSKEVTVKWNSRNRKYFEGLGYKFTKWFDEFIVPVDHLYKSSPVVVDVKCDYCTKKLTKVYRDYLVQLENSPIKKDCCSDCRGKKQIEVCQLKYGVNGVSQIPEIRQKQNDTIKEKYGVDNISQLDEIKEKKKQTTFKNFGVEHYSQLEEGKRKIKETLLEKYGVEHHLQIPEIYQKQIDTNLERYGVENVFQSEVIKEKTKQTFMTNYGVEHAIQVPEIAERARINANISLHKNNTAPCSRQQKYLHKVLGGELNYPLKTIILDIAFPEEMIDIEFDGSGHNLSVRCGNVTQKEFNIKESKRNYALLKSGWKIIRIVSTKDLLPLDDKILKMFNFAKEHLDNGNSWIEFNIEENLVRSSIFEESYDYGKLRVITDSDINKLTQVI